MTYELRQPGQPARQFETEAEAEAAARHAILADPDCQLELIDLTTGKPCAPAASAAWREELARRVGF